MPKKPKAWVRLLRKQRACFNLRPPPPTWDEATFQKWKHACETVVLDGVSNALAGQEDNELLKLIFVARAHSWIPQVEKISRDFKFVMRSF
jgi:hypothetical protein